LSKAISVNATHRAGNAFTAAASRVLRQRKMGFSGSNPLLVGVLETATIHANSDHPLLQNGLAC